MFRLAYIAQLIDPLYTEIIDPPESIRAVISQRVSAPHQTSFFEEPPTYSGFQTGEG